MTTRTLLFTDVVDSTLLVERLGDARAAEVWARHDRAARELLAQNQGHEIDRTDGFFLLFDAPADAARFALAYHVALRALDLTARVGVHVGEITLRENAPADVARGAKPVEVEGLAKPFAARVMALASGRQTLLSETARRALGAAPLDGAEIESHGHYRLKGVEAPVEVFELGTRGLSAFAPPPDADKAYRVVRAGELWAPLREVRHNLPAERDAFIGRSAELHALAQRLDAGARLVTLLGPGGTGKTRFARRYGRAWLGDWPGGVYFCDLCEARSADGIHFAVACALGVPLGKGDPAAQLGHAIAARGRCLVILDNFEQVTAHAQATLGCWLGRAAEAVFIVTSRERLQLQGEQVFPIDPLALATDAITLFEIRARAQRPGFVLDESNGAAVAKVVRLLDGLPLAIELAAARVRVLSPAQIAERLKDRFALLAGARGAAARQATLRAAIDWSWDLLAPWEQAALAQCSVFEGGFTLEAAEAVLSLAAWPEALPAIDAVQDLVDKSLLRAWVPVEHSRYDIDEPYFGMYISIHEYAHEKLVGSVADAARQAEQGHGRYYAHFGSDAAVEALSREGGVQRRRALALEIDNLVAACRRAVQRGDAPVAAASYRAAWEALVQQGPLMLGVTLGAEVLALGAALAAADRIEATMSRADALNRVGRMDEARAALDPALALARQTGDRRREGLLLYLLGELDREQGHMEGAKQYACAALAAHRDSGNRAAEATVLHALGNLLDQQGAVAESREHHEAALALRSAAGDRAGVGRVLASLGILCRHQGRVAQSQAHYEAALAIHREAGDRRSEGILLGNLGNLYLDQGRVAEAQAHYEQSLAIHRELGSRVPEGFALANLAAVHQRHGRLDLARNELEQALQISREGLNRWHEGIVLSQLGALAHKEEQLEASRRQFEQALVIHREVGHRGAEAIALGFLGDMLTRQGEVAQALTLLHQGSALLREIDNPFELGNVLCLRGEAEAAGGDLATARATLAEVEKIAGEIGAGTDSELAQRMARLRGAIG